MQKFFDSIDGINDFSLTLNTQARPPPCKHCGQTHAWMSHGYVYKQRTSSSLEPVGKRILCSKRGGKMGCGRTVRLYLSSDTPRRHYGANALFLFLSALIAGATLRQAYGQATGHKNTEDTEGARQGWRWLSRLVERLTVFRSQLSFDTAKTTLSSAFSHRCRRLRILLPTIHAMLPQCRSCPCAAYHKDTQMSLL